MSFIALYAVRLTATSRPRRFYLRDEGRPNTRAHATRYPTFDAARAAVEAVRPDNATITVAEVPDADPPVERTTPEVMLDWRGSRHRRRRKVAEEYWDDFMSGHPMSSDDY